MTKINEPDFFKFVYILHNYQSILRKVKVLGKVSTESDPEHSYQLAMLGWYLISKRKLNLNQELVLKYALVHDLVELYAGDTDTMATYSNTKNDKAKREYQALQRLEKEIYAFPELFTLIREFESLLTPEARFVYSLDKIIPQINSFFTGQSDYYKENKITYKKYKEVILSKLEKIIEADGKIDSSIKEHLDYFETIKGFYYEE